uniref:Uncharacterized protein MANES_15G160900 n=1 Tax=Rhizophora mucronata TaxID=61149 RepID=A0A2P2NU62_RHIMU
MSNSLGISISRYCVSVYQFTTDINNK